ncbi:MAG: DUF1326 domain-containing protein [Gemmatimonadota bacterium]|nr:DUF1326 domain-containing protein [Gemmatimonadota bacterium]
MNDWWAEGLLFENCNCTAVCPGHIHFSQRCTHEVCHGFWAIRFEGGRVGGTDLAGVEVVVVYEAPQVMVEGGWRQRIIVSDRADRGQRRAVEEIIAGVRGGPWEVLARFVSDALPTLSAPLHIDDAPERKAVTVAGLLESAVESIRGRNRENPVTFANIYNKVHDATQVIARGSARFDDGEIVIDNEGTHGLWSRFRWTGP